ISHLAPSYLSTAPPTSAIYTLSLHDALPILDVGIRMRILIWVGVLNHAAERLRFQHDPRAFSFLKVVSDLHAGAGRPTRLWSKLNFRMSLVPVDRKAANIHVHGAHIQSADGIQ